MAIFGKNEKDSDIDNSIISGSINMIGVGTTIDGDISCKGDIRVDGIIKGNIYSKAKVVIGLTGSLEGVITCVNADISGTLIGNISVSETLFLKSNGKVNGDIMTNKLIIEGGAQFTGNCNMGVITEKNKSNKDFQNGKEKVASKENSLA